MTNRELLDLLMREVTRLKAELARAETDKQWVGVGETGPVLFK